MAPSSVRSSGRSEEVNVQVIVRCRPPSEEERKARASQVLRCNEATREVTIFQQVAGKQIDRTFTFDRVFGTNTQQEHLFQTAIVPIVQEVLEGFNCTIFAYGQTGTGKTYTMTGGMEDLAYHSRELDERAGVIPRAIKHIFGALESAEAEYSVKASFLELYNEEITDLLAPDDANGSLIGGTERKMTLMEDGKGGVLVRGLDEVIVKNSSEIYSILERGTSKRRTAETLLNKQSSRSHSVFTITLHIKESTPEGEELIKCGKLNLVDLAGSENISRSGAKDKRAREAGEINKSLLTLGRVISSLVEHQGHVPYRDSKLTRLLRDSLGGRTKTCIIATVAPSMNCYEETASTLDYAHRAKNIRNKPEVNQRISKHAMIKDLTTEIDRLKQDLSATREKNGVYIAKERYEKDLEERKYMEHRLEELESDVEVKMKELEEAQQLYEQKCSQFKTLQQKQEQTSCELDNVKGKLSATEAALSEARDMVEVRDFAIERHSATHSNLMRVTQEIRQELEHSVGDVRILHEKLDKKALVEQGNAKTVHTCRETALQKIQKLEEAISVALKGQQTQFAEASSSLQQLMGRKEEALGSFQEHVNQMKGQIADISSTMVAAVQKQCDGATEELNSVSEEQNTFLTSLQDASKLLEQDLAGIRSNLDLALAGQIQQMKELILHQNESCDFILGAARGIVGSARSAFSDVELVATKADNTAREASENAAAQMSSLSEQMEQQAAKDQANLMEQVGKLVDGFMKKQSKAWSKSSKAVLGEVDRAGASMCDASGEILSVISNYTQILDSKEGSVTEITANAQGKLAERGTELEKASTDVQGMYIQMHDAVATHVATTAATGQAYTKKMEKAMKSAKGDLTKFVKAAEKESKKLVKDATKMYSLLGQDLRNAHDEEMRSLGSMKAIQEDCAGSMENFAGHQKEELASFSAMVSRYLRDEFEQDVATGSTPAKRVRSVPRLSEVDALRIPAFEQLVDEYRTTVEKEGPDRKRSRSSEDEMDSGKENEVEVPSKSLTPGTEDCRSPLSVVSNQ